MKTLSFSLVVGILFASLALAGQPAPVPAAPQSFDTAVQTGAPIPMGDCVSTDSYSYSVPMQVVATRTINTHYEGTPPTIPCPPAAPAPQAYSTPAPPCYSCGPPAPAPPAWNPPATSTYTISENCVGPQCGPEDSDGDIVQHAGGGFGDGPSQDGGEERRGLFGRRPGKRGPGLFGGRGLFGRR